MVDGKLLIEKLLVYAKHFLYLNELDEVYIRNTLLVHFKLQSPMAKVPELDYISHMTVPDVLFHEIEDYAMENSIADDKTQANLFAAFIMGSLTQKPAEINQYFKNVREKMGAQAACDYLYSISVMNNYVQKTAIGKNIKWTYKDGNNNLEITINLSKPEKDNKDIAKLAAMAGKPTDKYPKCALCHENEGFLGNYTQPPRANLRAVPIELYKNATSEEDKDKKETWYIQYSPYAYFDEHCIVFNKEHKPMQMGEGTVNRLLDFVELFPNYFIGSNSDLPIVGGSILNHEHYQGGKHLMPMHFAKALRTLSCEKHPDVEISILDWYNSVIRLVGYNRASVAALGTEIIEAWKGYADETVSIVNNETDPETLEKKRHNTCTVVARMIDSGRYCLEIILRNNYTSNKYPDGVFHAHPEYHNIKKEGIGLIEAMGLYILPGRLKKQLETISSILCKEEKFDYKEGDPMYVHKEMVERLLAENPNVSDRKTADEKVRNYVNKTCVAILDNTSVFKKDDEGNRAFDRFLTSVDIK